MLHKAYKITKWLFLISLLNFPAPGFSQQNDAELINQQTVIEVSEGRLVQTIFYEIQINNRRGDKYAEVSIPFDKMNKVLNIEAAIFDLFGNEIKKLKKSDIIERSEGSSDSFFDDNYVKEFELRHNTYPYTIKYSYRSEASQFLFIAHWFPVIDYEIPTRQARLKINTTEGYKINFYSNMVEKPKIDSIPGHIYYSWETSYKNSLKPETYSPPLSQFIPYVAIVPEKFKFENEGSHTSWTTYGEWNMSLLNGLDDLPLFEKFKIQALTDTIQDEKEKIRILFHYLQDATRYINVSIKTGGFKPYPASYVAENKYGDCKALSNYFRSCLAVINIKSFYTKINSGDLIETFHPDFPSQQFNHIILFIPLKQDTLWVDCTSDLAFGYLGTPTQNRPALVVDKNASVLINTPAMEFNDVLEIRKITAIISSDKNIKADFINTYKGDKYELLSYIQTSISESQRTQYLGKRIFESGYQMDTYSMSTPERDKPEIILKYTASSDQKIKEYGNELLVEIIPLKFPFLEEPLKRKLPVQINYPDYRIDSTEYLIPESYKIAVIPKNISIKSVYGEYQAEFQVKEHSVIVIKQVKINSGSYSLNQYREFYDFIINLSETENSFYISLTKL